MYDNQGAHGLDLWSETSQQIVYRNQFYGNRPGDKFKVSQQARGSLVFTVLAFPLLGSKWSFLTELSNRYGYSIRF